MNQIRRTELPPSYEGLAALGVFAKQWEAHAPLREQAQTLIATRGALRITPADMAEELGISVQEVYHIESGIVKPDRALVERYEAVCEKKRAWFVPVSHSGAAAPAL